MVDYNGDGTLNSFDSAPYAYPTRRPQNTYSITVGADYKWRGFSAMIQFYGVYNVIRGVSNVTPFGNPHEISNNLNINAKFLDGPENQPTLDSWSFFNSFTWGTGADFEIICQSGGRLDDKQKR